VLILLPPSEGKTAPARGPSLSMKSVDFAEFNPVRERILDALIKVSKGPRSRARTILGVSERLDHEIDRNVEARQAPCAPAGEIYTGVLYDALEWSTLTAAQRKRAGSRVAIASALFGLLRPTDVIPAYRLSADTTLPTIGTLRSAWSAIVPDAIRNAATRGIVLDLRSSAYMNLGPVPEDMAKRTVVARVLQQRGSKRVVVSHHNKATKGRLVRSLLGVGRITDIPDLTGVLGEAGYRVELSPGRNDSSPWLIDVIVDDI
jgi:cytoplasmic iron level regulating protein YaaA (DUF328/UPF0246 family)